jgi:hypothetical protein
LRPLSHLFRIAHTEPDSQQAAVAFMLLSDACDSAKFLLIGILIAPG